MALDSFSTCVSAAGSIALYLESYERVHTFQQVPYFLFYAAYVSATIHVRIAAQKQLESTSFTHLLISLRIFEKNKETSVAQKVKSRIEKLMIQMGVELPTTDISSRYMAEWQQQESLPTKAMWRHSSDAQSSQQEPGLPTIDHPLTSGSWNAEGSDLDALLRSFKSPSQDAGSAFQPADTSSETIATEPFDATYHIGDDELYGFDAPGI